VTAALPPERPKAFIRKAKIETVLSTVSQSTVSQRWDTLSDQGRVFAALSIDFAVNLRWSAPYPSAHGQGCGKC
jgi:hypothetical protein